MNCQYLNIRDPCTHLDFWFFLGNGIIWLGSRVVTRQQFMRSEQWLRSSAPSITPGPLPSVMPPPWRQKHFGVWLLICAIPTLPTFLLPAPLRRPLPLSLTITLTHSTLFHKGIEAIIWNKYNKIIRDKVIRKTASENVDSIRRSRPQGKREHRNSGHLF